MKKLIYKLLLLVPLLSILASINYMMDPANLFKLEYERGLAAILINQRNAANTANYDERLLQKYYIEGINKAPEIVVIGSSRSMQIGKEIFKNRTFFNNSVSGATIEDYYSLYDLYHRKGLKPSIVILGLDPWILNKNHDQGRWMTLQKYYYELLNTRTAKMKSLFYTISRKKDKFVTLFSLNYFQASVKELHNLIKTGKKPGTYFETDDIITDFNTKLSDGSISYNRETRNISADAARKCAIEYTRGEPLYSIGKFNVIDTDYLRQLNGLIDIMRKDNVKIIFFLPPYHPVSYNYMAKSDRYMIIRDVQREFKQIALTKNIKIIGSYNPRDCSFSERDFYDGYHPKRESLISLFKKNLLYFDK